MHDSFRVIITREDDQTVLGLVGDFDLGGVSAFEKAWASVDPSAERVVLDLSELTFVDSTALGRFVRSQNELEGRGAKLVLRKPSAPARRMLDIVDLGHSIEIID